MSKRGAHFLLKDAMRISYGSPTHLPCISCTSPAHLLRILCTSPAHPLRIPCASPAHPLRIPCEPHSGQPLLFCPYHWTRHDAHPKRQTRPFAYTDIRALDLPLGTSPSSPRIIKIVDTFCISVGTLPSCVSEAHGTSLGANWRPLHTTPLHMRP